ncbi:Cof-type HAD-IIB family hydrolase [Apilactobacillus kunkeei]|uniref:Cof-type HAD-IIB family hydrolase n=1 Tax=Apilactobacillus kunkeei TaxID=148814 RepID=UPI00403496D2
MIKMIALDLDNTLLNSAKEISVENVSTLQKLHKNGISVVLCTGRPINAVWPYVKQLGLTDENDYTITFNGGMVIRNHDQNILNQKGLSLDDFSLIHQYASDNDLPLDILDFEKVYELTDLVKSSYKEVLNSPLEFVQKDFSKLEDKPYSKAIMSEQVVTLNNARANFPAIINDHYKIVRSQPKIMEFLPLNMSKAYGLNILLKHLGMDFSNLMAFGDAENDYEMIEAAKMGVAMGNASDEIKAIATEITIDHDNDGVAFFLKSIF